MKISALQIRLVDDSIFQPLERFFETICANGDNRFFHPHPFTTAEVHRIVNYQGADLYYVLLQGEQIKGYGMLRGWDEGYEIPSLGIIISHDVRGAGLGDLLMRFLHAAARLRGAKKIRLTVHSDNTAAVKLYQKLGYALKADRPNQLVGYLDI